MLQALYAALPYALTNEQAARAVGRLLARAVRGETAAAPPTLDDIKELRHELREGLKKQFETIQKRIP
jgi:hypothetical protein